MIKLENISKIYKHEKVVTRALSGINLTIQQGEFIAIMGTSGSGKSTLLNIIGCMDIATQGSYYLKEQLVSGMSGSQLGKMRSTNISFVFQNFALMEKYNAYENIELPMLYQKIPQKQRKKTIIRVAKELGIANQLRKLPKQMSGGQQQRVALARAIASGADILLADEPTGALDYETGKELMFMLQQLNQGGKTIIVVTHNPEIAEIASRIIQIKDGRIYEEE